ncbi:hypothetical protein [Treponema sp. UBA7567]|uniref:hypothetical protein n=1 Tax=Treponema sp. UBA7567 TaxID=1947748 RepID=UPI0025EA904A|nr:hypothetical protein [Treponema sp. UBA7567]
MKKLFLILASVLLLGGCSVDDDTSASGGGVSSGGDDMAITTYPNVVEASRTVVEGGYLVDYVFYVDDLLKTAKEGVLELMFFIADKLGVNLSNETSVEKLSYEFYKVFNLNFKLGGKESLYDYNNYEFYETSQEYIKFHLVGVGEQSSVPRFYYSQYSKEFVVEFLTGSRFSGACFTIFEPFSNLKLSE